MGKYGVWMSTIWERLVYLAVVFVAGAAWWIFGVEENDEMGPRMYRSQTALNRPRAYISVKDILAGMRLWVKHGQCLTLRDASAWAV